MEKTGLTNFKSIYIDGTQTLEFISHHLFDFNAQVVRQPADIHPACQPSDFYAPFVFEEFRFFQ